ncbi:hypothetical protein U0070_016459, partial [Myodes glareolus]
MYALTGDEAKKGCLQHSRKPDRKVRTEITCPAGFGGVLSIERQPGPSDVAHVKDNDGNSFAPRIYGGIQTVSTIKDVTSLRSIFPKGDSSEESSPDEETHPSRRYVKTMMMNRLVMIICNRSVSSCSKLRAHNFSGKLEAERASQSGPTNKRPLRLLGSSQHSTPSAMPCSVQDPPLLPALRGSCTKESGSGRSVVRWDSREIVKDYEKSLTNPITAFLREQGRRRWFEDQLPDEDLPFTSILGLPHFIAHNVLLFHFSTTGLPHSSSVITPPSTRMVCCNAYGKYVVPKKEKRKKRKEIRRRRNRRRRRRKKEKDEIKKEKKRKEREERKEDSTEHFQVSVDKKIDQCKLSYDLTIGLKFQHVIASLPDSDFQWKMEVYQRPELWENDLFQLEAAFKTEVGTEMTDAQSILSLQPGRVPKVRNQQTFHRQQNSTHFTLTESTFPKEKRKCYAKDNDLFCLSSSKNMASRDTVPVAQESFVQVKEFGVCPHAAAVVLPRKSRRSLFLHGIVGLVLGVSEDHNKISDKHEVYFSSLGMPGDLWARAYEHHRTLYMCDHKIQCYNRIRILGLGEKGWRKTHQGRDTQGNNLAQFDPRKCLWGTAFMMLNNVNRPTVSRIVIVDLYEEEEKTEEVAMETEMQRQTKKQREEQRYLKKN